VSIPKLLGEIGGYRLVEELGRGSFGAVYRAVEVASGREVALKLFHRLDEPSTNALERFRREPEALARAGSHPNIVAVHAAGEVTGLPWYAMELVRGRSLDLILRERTRLPWREACDVARKIALALEHLHRAGIVHRDLKPSNVIVDDDTREPRLVDFGLAMDSLRQTKLTKTGQLLGTPLYMAPEQLRGQTDEVGPRTDVFALGLLFYELLVGERPYRADTWVGLCESVGVRAPEPPHRRVPDVPAAASAVCLRALEGRVEARYATAGELALDLERALRGERPRASSSTTWSSVLDWIVEPARRRVRLIAALAAAVVAAAALTALTIGQVRARLRYATLAEARSRLARSADELSKTAATSPLAVEMQKGRRPEASLDGAIEGALATVDAADAALVEAERAVPDDPDPGSSPRARAEAVRARRDGLALLGRAAAARGAPQRACDLLERALRRPPELAESERDRARARAIALDLARAEARAGRAAEARARLDGLVPSDVSVHRARLDLALLGGDAKEVDERARALIELGPDVATSLEVARALVDARALEPARLALARARAGLRENARSAGAAELAREADVVDALIVLASGKPLAAAALIEPIARGAAGDRRVQHALGQAWLAALEPERAIVALRAARSEDTPEVDLEIARALLIQLDLGEATRLLERAATAPAPLGAEAEMWLARTAPDGPTMRAHARAAVARADPVARARALALQGEVELLLGEPAGAREPLARALAAAPGDPEIAAALARCLAATGDPASARATLDGARDQGCRAILGARARVLEAQGKPERDAAWAAIAARLDEPTLARALLDAAADARVDAASPGFGPRRASALRVLQCARLLAPEDHRVAALLAEVAIEEERGRDAVRFALEARDAEPRGAIAGLLLARALLTDGRAEEARDEATRALALARGRYERESALEIRSRAHEAAHDLAAAQADCEAALAQMPSRDRHARRWVALAVRAGDPRATARARRALEAAQAAPAKANQLAERSGGAGKNPEAILEVLRRGLAVDPRSANCYHRSFAEHGWSFDLVSAWSDLAMAMRCPPPPVGVTRKRDYLLDLLQWDVGMPVASDPDQLRRDVGAKLEAQESTAIGAFSRGTMDVVFDEAGRGNDEMRDRGERELSRALRDDPEAAIAFPVRAHLRLQQGRLDGALQDFRLFAARGGDWIEPNEEFTRFEMAAIRARQGDAEATLRELGTAFDLGFTLLMRIEKERAIQDLIGKDPRFRDLLARARSKIEAASARPR
jgi:serine/threonine-protein kinase